MANRKRKGPPSVGPEPRNRKPGKVRLGDDFIGVVTPDGFVIDDTAYFRQQELERPIEMALQESEALRWARAKVEAAMAPLKERDEELARTIGIFHGWVEQAIVATCARLLDKERNKSPRKRASKRASKQA